MARQTDLARRIDESLLADERTADSAIEVLEESGIITLTGTATTHKARQAAGEIAESIEGVTTVVNDLEVENEDDVGMVRPPLVVRPTDTGAGR